MTQKKRDRLQYMISVMQAFAEGKGIEVTDCDGIEVMPSRDGDFYTDKALYELGNYFATKEEAESMASKFRAILAGADVIQIPSGAEILDAAEEHVEACDEDGCPYADAEDAKAAFGSGVYWLISKKIK